MMKVPSISVRSFVRAMKRFPQEESGQTVVIGALFMGLLAIGFLALATDIGLLFRKQRMAQQAADAAAMAAAIELAGTNSGDEQTVANGVAKHNGFDTTLTTNPATVNLTVPCSFNGGSCVTAVVSQPVTTTFLRAFRSNLGTITIGATGSAASSGGSSPTCICLEGGSGEDLNMSNNSKINAAGCGVVDDSTSSNAVGIVGSATLSALSLGTVSTNWDNSNNINNNGSITTSTKVVQGIPACSVTMPAAPAYSGCTADPGGSYGTFTWGPSTAGGTICYNGLTIGANGATTTLNPGVYVIATGNLHFESGSGGHSNLGGNGVFFYVISGSVTIDNGANVNLVAGGALESNGSTSAPSTGTAYNGIVIYEPSSNTSGITAAGGSSTFMNGSVYVPGAVYTMNNGSGSTVSGGVVASGLTMAGGGTFTATTTTNEGSLSTGGPTKVVQ